MHIRCRKQLISTLAALLTIMTLVIFQLRDVSVAQADYSITVSPAQQYQTIQGWGTSMAWWANIIGGWSSSQRTALANALYDTSDGIGLNLARYNFGADGPGNTCHNQMGQGRNVPSFEPTAGTYNWSNDANQLWFAQAAKARGADVFEGFVNSAPAWMLKNSCTAGGPGGAENLSSAHYTDYANYIATIDKHFHDSFGITFQTVDAFNEPSGTYWNSTNTQEGMFVSHSTQNTIVPLLASALAQNGASAYTGISAPDDETVANSNSAYEAYASSTKADLVQWNTHTYGASDSDRNYAYTNIGQTDHKRLWMSEWGTGSQGSQIGGALALSHEILDDEHNLHPSSWVAWQAVNEAGDAPDSVWGLAYRDSNNTISYPSRYYAMGNYSKFVREGYQVIGNSDANTLTAYNASTHSLVLVTTNSGSSSTTVSYNLSGFSSVGSSATPYQTSASKNLQQLSAATISNKTFSSALPGQSITTFVIPNVTYTAGGGTTPTPTPTPGGGTFNPNSHYRIVNRNSGQVLDVTSASTASGALIDQWPSNGGANQLWRFVAVNAGYKLVNVNSSKVLDDPGASKTNGTQLDQASDTNSSNQWWNVVSLGSGYYSLVNQSSGQYADVTGASTTNGAAVIQWPSTGGTNQQWSLVQVS